MLCTIGRAVWGQEVTPKAPPESGSIPPVGYPDAVPLVQETGDRAVLESARQTVLRSGDDKIFVLDGAVVVTLGDREIRADHVEYDELTGDVTADGHLVVTGGPNHEHLEASHGTLNVRTETGRFYDVTGSVEMSAGKARDEKVGPKVYSNGRPFLFTGRVVVKTGPRSYDLYGGTVTSCQLPKPDWLLEAGHFSVTDEMARGRNSTFRVLRVPVFFLPYVTHPTDPETRESGFMIPSVGLSTSRGLTLEDQFYLVLNRSMDLTVGAAYYSSIGWAQDATFRYRGAGLDFVKAHYTGVLDKRDAAQNEGGEDVLLSARRDFSKETRLASDLEYLSSYVYREAFTDSFNQAVTSDITSRVYLTHMDRGFEVAALVDRYQGIKLIAQGTSPQQQVRIFHAPELAVATTEHRLGDSPVEWTLDASMDGLKRQQPNFATGGIVERVDVRPEVALPFHLGEWRFRPSVGMEETAYTRSVNPASPGVPATQRDSRLSRTDVHGEVSLRSPVLERVYAPTHWTGVLGSALKHTMELETTYRVRSGVDNFRHTLRFDPIDVVANTNEMEYGMTQRVFRKRRSATSCGEGSALPNAPDAAADVAEADEGGFNPDPTLSVGNEVGAYSAAGKDGCQSEELISWRLTQKYFLDPSFGGAIQNGRRNVFDTTLMLSGVAFLTEAREISPLISRLRVRASSHADVEWDFDYDTGATKITSSNVYLDGHATNGLFGALSYALLDAPGRFYTEAITNTSTTGVSTAISNFNQLRLLMGYGGPSKRGLSIAANTGLDLKSISGATGTQTTSTGLSQKVTVYPPLLQYATLQASYNWDCCGFSVEYRKFELGSVRNEGSYRFNFTLANIGTAGNLRRSARLF